MSYQFHVANWAYKGEGNSNLVLSFCGPRSSSLDGCILRLRKDESTSDTELPADFWNARKLVEYRDLVIRPLLGEDYVARALAVDVDNEFLEGIAASQTIKDARPPYRRSRNVDVRQRWALLELDHTVTLGGRLMVSSKSRWNEQQDGQSLSEQSVEVIAFEIKPKWGFKRSLVSEAARFISKDNLATKVNACRFCMHRIWKDRNAIERTTGASPSHHEANTFQGHVSVGHSREAPTRFCPLDMYSEEHSRILASCEWLFRDPRNNFALHINGQLVDITELWGEDEPSWVSSLSRFLDVLGVNANPHMDIKSGCLVRLINVFADVISYEPEPLHNLRRHQGGLDSIDIEGVFPLYLDVVATHGGYADSLLDCSPVEWQQVMERYRHRVAVDYGMLPLEDKLQLIREFMVSATLKDCTLLVTLGRSTDGSSREEGSSVPPTATLPGTQASEILECLEVQRVRQLNLISGTPSQGGDVNFTYKMTFVDTDPKPTSRIPHYYRLDRDIVENAALFGLECFE
ncbi:Inositol-pentakisphosphate 2-kinase [Gonapodya sp. JEL0774]|nr:Inositol-pentakisphosphate 2-kinase [Gonapodya sp. JEL0774]